MPQGLGHTDHEDQATCTPTRSCTHRSQPMLPAEAAVTNTTSKLLLSTGNLLSQWQPDMAWGCGLTWTKGTQDLLSGRVLVCPFSMPGTPDVHAACAVLLLSQERGLNTGSSCGLSDTAGLRVLPRASLSMLATAQEARDTETHGRRAEGAGARPLRCAWVLSLSCPCHCPHLVSCQGWGS